MDPKGGKRRGGGGGGVMNWEIGVDMYTLTCIKWITNKNLLYKEINKIQKLNKIQKKNSSLDSIYLSSCHPNFLSSFIAKLLKKSCLFFS